MRLFGFAMAVFGFGVVWLIAGLFLDRFSGLLLMFRVGKLQDGSITVHSGV